MLRSALCAVLLALAATASLRAQTVGLNSLAEVEFSKLSERDPNPFAARALAMQPEQWKHGETDHFIYHFTQSYVATPVSVEAEFYYRVITKELQREQLSTGPKSHIYIFETAEAWQQFQQAGQLEQWTGGIQSRGSLFIHRDPKYKFADNTLGHEIAHLVLYRLYPEGVPLWLNEGFAEYISRTAQASYQRARGYLAKPRSQRIAVADLIPLNTLVGLASVPSDNVEAFYDESERLVRFLIATDKPDFLQLLDSLGKHQPFDTAMLRIYAGRFASVALFEERFREYATESDSG